MTRRDPRVLPLAICTLLAGLLAPPAAGAQAAGMLGALDPALRDLVRLEAFGLVSRKWSPQRPLSVGRASRMVRDARRALEEARLPEDARSDLDVLLRRLEERLGRAEARGASFVVEAEGGGGHAPGRPIPPNGLGGVDAVVMPIWAQRAGRTYGDRSSVAGTARGTLALGSHAAVGVAVRAVGARWSGAEQGREPGVQAEAAWVRAVAGRLALQVGRDHVAWDAEHLLLSGNAPALDMIRVGTDRPLDLPALGRTDLSFLAADLGADREFPHGRLYGLRLESHPSPAFRFGVSMLDRQGGRGAPTASLGSRLKDLLLPWTGSERPGPGEFSDKMVGADVRLELPGARGSALRGEAALTYVERARLVESLGWGGGYRVGLEVPRLGPTQRHALSVEAVTLGPYVYRHHTFVTGSAVEGLLLGSPLGPDARSLLARYRYDAPGSAGVLTLEASIERRRGDVYADEPGTPPRLVKIVDRPDEDRRRARAGVLLPAFEGLGGVELWTAVERVGNAGFEAGRSEVHWGLLIRAWRAF